MTENVHVRRWETHLKPRTVSTYEENVSGKLDGSSHNDTAVPEEASASTAKAGAKATPDIDTFGDIAGVEKIDRGWLTTETVFQFKFIRNPFTIRQKLKNKLLYVKVSIANKRIFQVLSVFHQI